MKRCIQITEDFERSMNQKLSFSDKMEIYGHKILCKKCNRYMKDSRTLENLIKQHAKQEFSISKKFSQEEKDRMKNKLGSA